MGRMITASLSLLALLELSVPSEGSKQDKVCVGQQRACCDKGKTVCDNKHADDCCEKQWFSCNQGHCVNTHGCRKDQHDCCNLLSGIPCLNGHKCPLSCKCCEQHEFCFLESPLLGFVCLSKHAEEL